MSFKELQEKSYPQRYFFGEKNTDFLLNHVKIHVICEKSFLTKIDI